MGRVQELVAMDTAVPKDIIAATTAYVVVFLEQVILLLPVLGRIYGRAYKLYLNNLKFWTADGFSNVINFSWQEKPHRLYSFTSSQ